MSARLVVDVMFDEEAGVYVATSDNIPGLATESPDIASLRSKLVDMIPRLLQLNGLEIPKSVSFEVHDALSLA